MDDNRTKMRKGKELAGESILLSSFYRRLLKINHSVKC